MNAPSHPPQAKRLDTLEPSGSQIVLGDLLRWRLAASQLPFSQRTVTDRAGTQRSRLRGRGIDFDEVRLYQAGDDVRAIDWRVTARTNKAHTKVFREERERTVMLLVDLRSHLFFGSRHAFKSVVVAHAAALLGWAALAAGDRIGALVLDDNGITDIRPRRSRHTLLQLFRKVLQVQRSFNEQQTRPVVHNIPPDKAGMAPLLKHLHAVCRPGSCIIMLSDFHDWNEQCPTILFPVVRHSQCFALRVTDTLETTLPAVGNVRMRFLGALRSVDTQRDALRSRFAQLQATRTARWQQDWRTLRATGQTLATHEPLLPAVRRLMLSRQPSGNTRQAP